MVDHSVLVPIHLVLHVGIDEAEGDIHYHIYIPDNHDGSEPYVLFSPSPATRGCTSRGVGENLYTEEFAFAAMDYNDRMIIAAPQLNDWGRPPPGRPSL